MNAISNADIADATEQLDLLLDTISRMRSPIFLQNFINSFIRRLSELLVKSGKRPEKILDRQTLERLYLPENYHDDLRSCFIEVITAVIHATNSSSEQRMEQYYAGVLAYIQEHYAEDLSLGDVSEHLSISKNYVNVVIRACADMTFVQLLTKIRIDTACDLLKTRNYTINEVSEKVGFNSPRYFIQVFKRQMGVTPGQFLF